MQDSRMEALGAFFFFKNPKTSRSVTSGGAKREYVHGGRYAALAAITPGAPGMEQRVLQYLAGFAHMEGQGLLR